MKTLTLKRIAENEDGTFGVLLDGNTPFAVTLEREWLNNQPMESCISAGDYICKRVVTPKHGEVFEVTGVKNRTAILFHKGNVEDHSKGCILVGEQFETLDGKTAILQSGKGFTEFLERLKGRDEFQLAVKEIMEL